MRHVWALFTSISLLRDDDSQGPNESSFVLNGRAESVVLTAFSCFSWRPSNRGVRKCVWPLPHRP